MVIRRYPPGVILDPYDVRRLMILKEGTLERFFLAEDGRELRIAVLEAPEMPNLPDFCTGRAVGGLLKTVTGCRIGFVESEGPVDLCRRFPELAEDVPGCLDAFLELILRRHGTAYFNDAAGRVARSLMARFENGGDGVPGVDELSRDCGLSRSAVYNALDTLGKDVESRDALRRHVVEF